MEENWEGCPYNYKVHVRELEKIQKGEVEDPYGHDQKYHQSRIDRCLDWLHEQRKKTHKLNK